MIVALYVSYLWLSIPRKGSMTNGDLVRFFCSDTIIESIEIHRNPGCDFVIKAMLKIWNTKYR